MTTTTLRLPIRIARLPQLRQIVRGGLAARGSMGAGLATQRSGAGFVGAYDNIPSITAAYGMRRLRVLYTGSLLRLRRSSDNAESDFGYDASGHLDVAAIATWLGGGSGYVTTLYNQAGSGNVTQATSESQPLYVASGQNGRPILRFDGVNDFVSLPNLSSLTAGTGLIVLRRASSPPIADSRTYLGLWRIGSSADDDYDPYSNGIIYQSFGSTTRRNIGSMSDATSQLWRVYCFASASGEWTGRKNGAQFYTTATNTVGFSSAPTLCKSVGYYYGGEVAELVICNAALSTADRQAAEAGANAYWSIY